MAELNLIGLIKAKGHEVSQQFTKLWSEPEIMAEGILPSQLEIRVSADYADSVYAIIRGGGESKLVSFVQGELDPETLTVDDNGVVIEGLEGLTFSLAEVIALSDRTDLNVKKGDKKLKLYVE